MLQAEEHEQGFRKEREARTKDKAAHEDKIKQKELEIENLKMKNKDLNMKIQNLTSRNECLAKDKKNLIEQMNRMATPQ